VPELPYKLVSNSLFPDSVARLLSAAAVDATLVGVLLGLGLARAEDWLPPMLPIDIMSPR
jgi:hypothetical protein